MESDQGINEPFKIFLSKIENGIFSVNGRITRRTYFSRVIFAISILLLILTPYLYFYESGNDSFYNCTLYKNLCFYVFPASAIVFIIIQRIKRMHDINKSGWSCFIPLISFVKGSNKDNDFGLNPRLNTPQYFDQIEMYQLERNTLIIRKKKNIIIYLSIYIFFIVFCLSPIVIESFHKDVDQINITSDDYLGLFVVKQVHNEKESIQMYAEIKELDLDNYEVTLYSEFGKEVGYFKRLKDETLFSEKFGKGFIQKTEHVIKKVLIVFKDNSNIVWKFTKSE